MLLPRVFLSVSELDNRKRLLEYLSELPILCENCPCPNDVLLRIIESLMTFTDYHTLLVNKQVIFPYFILGSTWRNLLTFKECF